MAKPLYGSSNFSTTLNVGGGITNSQTTGIVLTSVSGLNTSGGMLGLTWASTLDSSLYEVIEYGGVSGNELTGVIRGQAGTSGKAHNNGATVVAIVSKEHNNRLADKLRSVDATLAQDTSDNEIIKTSFVASAVNEVTITNAATGNPPSLSATGGDTNIDFRLTPKGSGAVTVPSGTYESNVTDDDDIPNKKYVDDKVATGASTDGWSTISDTLTYASATSFTIAGVDRTTTYTKGTRIKLTQTTAKYFVVTSSSFATDTTVNVTGGTDYTLANAAITSPYYSYQLNPQGYPTWFAYSTTWGGFSANPNGTFRFSVVGTVASVQYIPNSAGTSNATSLTFTLPIAAADTTTVMSFCYVKDNSSNSDTAGYVTITGSSTTATVFRAFSSSTWTGSGAKDFFPPIMTYRF